MDDTLKKEIRTFYDSASQITITDENFLEAQESLKTAKEMEKKIKAYWKPMKEKASAAHKEICANEKAFLNPLSAAYEKVRQLVGAFQTEKEAEERRIQQKEDARLRKIEEDKQIEAAEALEKEGRTEEAEAVIEQPIFTAPPIVHQAPKARGISFREKWDFSISNPAIVPRELCTPDLGKIRKLVQAYKGDFKKPGIKVTMQKIPNTRIN